MEQSTHIKQIYNSRVNLLDMLEDDSFDISNYKGESIEEVNTMNQNDQLDMLIQKKEKKIYIKYHLAKTIRPQYIYEYIEDIFTIEEILNKNDDLVIISKDNINDTITKLLKKIWSDDGIFIRIINIKALQFNILKHELVPKHRVLNEKETLEFNKKYNITDIRQIPDISRFSPVSLIIGIRPGEICEITRYTPTTINTLFYRVCI